VDTPRAEDLARSLRLAVLQGEGKTDEVVAVLRKSAAEAGDDVRPRLAVVEVLIAAGDLAEAKTELQGILDEDPDSHAARLLLANILSRDHDTAEAERIYRDLIAEIPEIRLPYEGLASLLHRSGRADEAHAVLDAGIAATDRAGSLVNMKAELHILQEDFEKAIELYNTLYERDPSNVVVANNLATLLSSHRDDEESLRQAFKAARRLRGSENPYYQDTYGWILTRRGDAAQALTYLEPAAKALGKDPLTQYHLGISYFDLQRWDEARAALSRAIEIAGDGSDLPQIEDARQRIAEIEKRRAAAPSAGSSSQ
jgi:predicted Zn-dependent protease